MRHMKNICHSTKKPSKKIRETTFFALPNLVVHGKTSKDLGRKKKMKIDKGRERKGPVNARWLPSSLALLKTL